MAHQAAPATLQPTPGEWGNLCGLPRSTSARVVRVEAGAEDSSRLMALGICVGRCVQIVKLGDPLIIEVVGTRVGLSARLAASVFVELMAEANRAFSHYGRF